MIFFQRKEKLKPLYEALGRELRHMGSSGDGLARIFEAAEGAAPEEYKKIGKAIGHLDKATDVLS